MFESVFIHFHSHACLETISFISTGNAISTFCLVWLWETAGAGATRNTETHRLNDQSKSTQAGSTTFQGDPGSPHCTLEVQLQKRAIIRDNVNYKVHPGKLILGFY